MTEPISEQISQEEDLKRKREKYIALAETLSKKIEGCPFPGINPESYTKLKAVDEEYPGWSTDTDLIIEKMKKGIKVTRGDHPESGNVFILPLSSDDFDDSLSPHDLEITDDMDESLKQLIEASIDINRG